MQELMEKECGNCGYMFKTFVHNQASFQLSSFCSYHCFTDFLEQSGVSLDDVEDNDSACFGRC